MFLTSFDDSRNCGFLKIIKAKKEIICWAEGVFPGSHPPCHTQAGDGRAGPMGVSQWPQAKHEIMVVPALPLPGHHLFSTQMAIKKSY